MTSAQLRTLQRVVELDARIPVGETVDQHGRLRGQVMWFGMQARMAKVMRAEGVVESVLRYTGERRAEIEASRDARVGRARELLNEDAAAKWPAAARLLYEAENLQRKIDERVDVITASGRALVDAAAIRRPRARV